MKRLYSFVLLSAPVLATGCCPYRPAGPMGSMGLWNNEYMMNYGFGYGGVFMWLIFLIILGVAVYFIVKSSKTGNVSGQTQETALDILKKRYAKGEISKEDFDRMKKDLE